MSWFLNISVVLLVINKSSFKIVTTNNLLKDYPVRDRVYQSASRNTGFSELTSRYRVSQSAFGGRILFFFAADIVKSDIQRRKCLCVILILYS